MGMRSCRALSSGLQFRVVFRVSCSWHDLIHTASANLLAGLIVCLVGCATPPRQSVANGAHSSPVSQQFPAATSKGWLPQPRLHRAMRSSLLVGDRRFSLHLPQDQPPPLPTVLVFHSAMGRTPSVLSWCDRLAERGFAAVALDFFDGQLAQSPEEGLVLRDAANAKSAELRHIVQQTYSRTKTDSRLLASKRFLLGWSFGGAWATYLAGVLPEVTGVVAYYGQAFTDDPELHKKVEAPILLIGGRADSAPPPERLQSIARTLLSDGKSAELLLVPAGHGFAEQNHPGYSQEASESAWSATVDFLEARAQSRPPSL